MRITAPLHGIGDEKHPAVDQADGVEAQLVTVIATVKFDDIGVDEYFCRRPQVGTVFLPVGRFLGAVLFEIYRSPCRVYW